MRCSRMCLLSTGRPVRRGHLRVQGHGWRAGSQGRGPAGARQDRRGTCGRPSVPGSSPRWHGGEACAGQEGGHAEVAAWDRQAPMAAVSSVSVVVHTETPARSAAVKLGTWCRVLCPVSQHVTWRGNLVRRVAWKPRCVAWRRNPGELAAVRGGRAGPGLPSPGPGDSAVRSAVTDVPARTARVSPRMPCAPWGRPPVLCHQ